MATMAQRLIPFRETTSPTLTNILPIPNVITTEMMQRLRGSVTSTLPLIKVLIPTTAIEPNTTYAEVTGAVMLTRNFNPNIMTWAAVWAIAISFCGKVGAFLSTIPTIVMGGIMMLVFGSIAVVGMSTLIKRCDRTS